MHRALPRFLRQARRDAAGALALTAVLAASCRHPATALMVVVETDMPQGPGALLESVRVEVFSQEDPDGPHFTRSFGLGETDDDLLPRRLLVTPRGNDGTRRVRLRVSALRGAEVLVTSEASVPFRAGIVGDVRIFLADRCRDASNRACAEGTVCGRSGCEAILRPAPPLYDPRAPLERDAATPADVHTDLVVTEDGAPEDVVADARNEHPDATHEDAPPPTMDAGSEDARADTLADASAEDAQDDTSDVVSRDGRDDALADAPECTRCGSASCVDLDFDDAHCGACGQPCAEGRWCDRGQCQNRCSGQTTFCPSTNRCHNLLYDPQHCGACGAACASDTACRAGSCVPLAETLGSCEVPFDLGELQGSHAELVVPLARPTFLFPRVTSRCSEYTQFNYIQFSTRNRSLISIENLRPPPPPGPFFLPSLTRFGYLGTSCRTDSLPASDCAPQVCGGDRRSITKTLSTSVFTRHRFIVESTSSLTEYTDFNFHSILVGDGPDPVEATFSTIGQTIRFGPHIGTISCSGFSRSAPLSRVYFTQCPTQTRGQAYSVRLRDCVTGPPGRYFAVMETSRGVLCASSPRCSGAACPVPAVSCDSHSWRFELPRGTQGPVMLTVAYIPVVSEPPPPELRLLLEALPD